MDREARKFKQQFDQLQARAADQKRRAAVEMEKAKKEQKRLEDMVAFHGHSGDWIYSIPDAPTFYPSSEDFKDPMQYIRSIQGHASQWGICKIVPPATPAIPPATIINQSQSKFAFTTRQQTVKQASWDRFNSARFYESDRKYTLTEFEKKADAFQYKRFGSAGSLPAKMVEAEYWRHFESGEGMVVEYGNDVEGTAFATPDSNDPLAKTQWNLQVLPTVEESTLRLLGRDIPGVTSPMLYIGMLFATFAWHVEDQYLYSINYQHAGAAKTWYGVPASGADGFERVVEDQVYREAMATAAREGKSLEEARICAHNALKDKTTMFCPKLLIDAGVPVCRAVQNPGEFIITFPRGYHGGFSNGFNLGEAANFAMADWFGFGTDACLRYSRLKRRPMLPQEQLLCIEAELLQKRRQSGSEACTSSSVQHSFVSLIAEQTDAIQKLQAQGAEVKVAGHNSQAGIPCDLCFHISFLAHALMNQSRDVCCLRCAQKEPQHLDGVFIFCHRKLAAYEHLAAEFEEQLRSGKVPESTLRMEGLTEASHWASDPQGFLSDSDHSRDGSDTSQVDAEGHSLWHASALRKISAKRKTQQDTDHLCQPKRHRIEGPVSVPIKEPNAGLMEGAAIAFLRALDRKQNSQQSQHSLSTSTMPAVETVAEQDDHAHTAEAKPANDERRRNLSEPLKSSERAQPGKAGNGPAAAYGMSTQEAEDRMPCASKAAVPATGSLPDSNISGPDEVQTLGTAVPETRKRVVQQQERVEHGGSAPVMVERHLQGDVGQVGLATATEQSLSESEPEISDSSQDGLALNAAGGSNSGAAEVDSRQKGTPAEQLLNLDQLETTPAADTCLACLPGVPQLTLQPKNQQEGSQMAGQRQLPPFEILEGEASRCEQPQPGFSPEPSSSVPEAESQGATAKAGGRACKKGSKRLQVRTQVAKQLKVSCQALSVRLDTQMPPAQTCQSDSGFLQQGPASCPPESRGEAEVDWAEELRLAQGNLPPAGFTRHSSWHTILQRHQASWERKPSSKRAKPSKVAVLSMKRKSEK